MKEQIDTAALVTVLKMQSAIYSPLEAVRAAEASLELCARAGVPEDNDDVIRMTILYYRALIARAAQYRR